MIPSVTFTMKNGMIVSHRIDFIDAITWDEEFGICNIWYNYEPKEWYKQYKVPTMYLDKINFEKLLFAWHNEQSVFVEECEPKKLSYNQDMQHEMFKSS